NGRSNGLAARIFGTRAAARVAEEHPGDYVFFSNEVPDLAGGIGEMELWLKRGACGIGEMKYALACDGAEMRKVYDLAKEYDVPVLLHFQYGMYNEGFERFHKILEAYPTVNFIGHAQTWWGNVDANHEKAAMYPGWRVTPGGLTERYLSDYPNMYGDLSAGSGLNAMLRDTEFVERFFYRHQDKLCLGTDCSDAYGAGGGCSGARMIETVRRWVPDEDARAKIMSGNARRIIRL
ncbi:MAG: amidohydrolase family protein, partial [Verrucomicrobiales bacterium]|nr:amidohydrolase family protein [Verrucomicrobiales bacterium]